MYLLDTDMVSLLFRGAEHYPRLIERVQRFEASGEISISIITVEEMLRGAFAVIRAEQQKGHGTTGYRRLQDLTGYFSHFPIISYDDDAATLFQVMPPTVRRTGRGDCQIAAIALLHDAVVVTRNLRHFSVIPHLSCEDWTK